MKDALVYALVALAREVLWWLTRPQPATGAEPDPDQSRYTRTWDQLEAFAMHTPAHGYAFGATLAARAGKEWVASRGVQEAGRALGSDANVPRVDCLRGRNSAVAGLGAVIHHAMAVDLQFASKVVDLIEAEFVESEHA